MPSKKDRLTEQRDDGLYLWCSQGHHFKHEDEFTPSRGTNATANCQHCRDVNKNAVSNTSRRVSGLSQTSAADEEGEDVPPSGTGSVIEVDPQVRDVDVEFRDPEPVRPPSLFTYLC